MSRSIDRDAAGVGRSWSSGEDREEVVGLVKHGGGVTYVRRTDRGVIL